MQRSERIALETFREAVARSGLDARLDHGGKHPRIVVVAPCGWTQVVPLACSGRSDLTCQANFARQKAARVLRAYESRCLH